MIKNKIISPEELSDYGSINDFESRLLALLKQQTATWETVGKNFEVLNSVQTKEFDFGHFKIITQFNPERIRSSAAKTDVKSLAERACFLCSENLPEMQKGIVFQEKYIILANPFPIFSKHIVISGFQHVQQEIMPYFADMLDLSKTLPDFTIFYNGPKCGASAPDHFHFQGIGKGNLLVEQEFEYLMKNHSELLVQDENVKIVAVKDYLRKFIAIISSDKNVLKEKFAQVYHLLDINDGEEPMINVLCSFTGNEWRIIIFPRAKQRPSHFFKEDGDRIVVGPAAVEMSGILVLPRKEDFLKISKKEIEEIYDEVSIHNEEFNNLRHRIKSQDI